MQGILVIAHGSRDKKTEDMFEVIVSMLRDKLNNIIVESAFLEFSDKNIKTGLKILVDKGVDDIKIIPYFLFKGVHMKRDIPNEIHEFIEQNEGVKVQLGEEIGVDERIVEILEERTKAIL